MKKAELLLLVGCWVAASAYGASISGTIFDASGAVVPSARVTLLNLVTGAVQTGATDQAGQYTFREIAPGAYRLGVEKPGFLFVQEPANVANQARVDVVLQLGTVRERLVVEAPPGVGAPSGPKRVRVGGDVQPARLIAQVRPQYPAGAQAAGSVVVRGVILMSGSLSGLQVLSSPDRQLTEAALEALRQWRYQPTLLNGQPVETVTTISVEFQAGSSRQ